MISCITLLNYTQITSTYNAGCPPLPLLALIQNKHIKKKVVVNTLLLFRTIAKFKPYYLTIFVFMPHTKLNYTTNKILYHNLRFSKRIYIKLLSYSLILVAIWMQNWKLLGICNLWKGTLEVYNGGISEARYTLEEYCIALFTTRFSHHQTVV